MITLGDAATFALWLGAACEGDAAPDDVAEEWPDLIVHDWPGDVGSTGISVVAARLAAARPAPGIALVVAAPGDPGGLHAHPDLVRQAVVAGAAILIRPLQLALVPGPEASNWTAHPVDIDGIQVPNRVDAERTLRRAVRTATEELEELDVAAGRDRVDPSLLRRPRRPVPKRTPSDRLALLDLALRIDAVIGAADLDPGAALSASALNARREHLSDLRYCVRRAVEAAASMPWPPR